MLDIYRPMSIDIPREPLPPEQQAKLRKQRERELAAMAAEAPKADYGNLHQRRIEAARMLDGQWYTFSAMGKNLRHCSHWLKEMGYIKTMSKPQREAMAGGRSRIVTREFMSLGAKGQAWLARMDLLGDENPWLTLSRQDATAKRQMAIMDYLLDNSQCRLLDIIKNVSLSRYSVRMVIRWAQKHGYLIAIGTTTDFGTPAHHYSLSEAGQRWARIMRNER